MLVKLQNELVNWHKQGCAPVLIFAVHKENRDESVG